MYNITRKWCRIPGENGMIWNMQKNPKKQKQKKHPTQQKKNKKQNKTTTIIKPCEIYHDAILSSHYIVTPVSYIAAAYLKIKRVSIRAAMTKSKDFHKWSALVELDMPMAITIFLFVIIFMCKSS